MTPTSPTPAALRAARERAGLTQAGAAAQVCVALNTWSQWERGLRQMPPGLWKLFRMLNPNGGSTP